MAVVVPQENLLTWSKHAVESQGPRETDQQLARKCQEGSFYPHSSDDEAHVCQCQREVLGEDPIREDSLSRAANSSPSLALSRSQSHPGKAEAIEP